MIEDHELEIQFDHDGGLTAVCSCGWFKEGVINNRDAHDWWDDHCDVVFMEATMQ